MLSPKIPIERILDDIRGGLGDVPIMEKYQISPGDLLRIKQQFKGGREVSGEVSRSAQAAPREHRSLSRHEPLRPITVYDTDDPRMQGTIYDINMKGLQVVGIIVRTGENKTLKIHSEPYNVHATFTFRVQCQWSMIDEHGNCVAGFRITRISLEDAKELKKLVACLSVSAGGM